MSKNSLHGVEMSRRVIVVVGAAFLFLVSGLVMTLPLAHAQSTVVVSIQSGAGSGQSAAPGYKPDSVTVAVGVNNTLTWTNNDTVHHTVTPVSEPAGTPWSSGSGDLAPGASYSFTFTVPGTYTFKCNYHTWMTGTIVVEAASTTTSTTTHTTPEFPVAWLAAVLFAVIAAVMVAAPRLRPSRVGTPSV